jgi:hypothetical protein
VSAPVAPPTVTPGSAPARSRDRRHRIPSAAACTPRGAVRRRRRPGSRSRPPDRVLAVAEGTGRGARSARTGGLLRDDRSVSSWPGFRIGLGPRTCYTEAWPRNAYRPS